MRHRAVAQLLLLAGVGLTPTCSREPSASTTQAGREFLSAAARGDSMALESLTTNSDSRRRVWEYARHRPGLVAAAAMSITLVHLEVRSDTAFATFTIPGSAQRGRDFVMSLVRVHDAWKVSYFAAPQ